MTATRDWLRRFRRPDVGAPSLGANATIFLLFFGYALIDSVTSFNWGVALFWIVVLLLFLLMTRRPDPPAEPSDSSGER